MREREREKERERERENKYVRKGLLDIQHICALQRAVYDYVSRCRALCAARSITLCLYVSVSLCLYVSVSLCLCVSVCICVSVSHLCSYIAYIITYIIPLYNIYHTCESGNAGSYITVRE